MMNPFLDSNKTLPRYKDMEAEQVAPALEACLAAARVAVKHAETAVPDWDVFVVPLHAALENLGQVWGHVGHLQAVVSTSALRQVYNDHLEPISAFYTDLGQNERLYAQWKALPFRSDTSPSVQARSAVLQHTLRDFRLAGVALPPDKKARFKTIQAELAKASARFSQNVLDATDDFAFYVNDAAQLAGLPADCLALAAHAAKEAGKPGWKVTLHASSYGAVMRWAEDRLLRETLYHAQVTRASELGNPAWDNTSVIDTLHRLRQESAQLLGFSDFAALSLTSKMAEKTDTVLSFLNNLAQKARPAMQNDRRDMQAYAIERLGYSSLEAWDLAYVSEQIRQEYHAFSEQELKQYFTEPQVLSGLLELINTLFAVSLLPEAASIWHPDVRFYAVYNEHGVKIGGLYLDLYARSHKQGGAWMNEIRARYRKPDGQIQDPLAVIVCNFMPGVDGAPALLTHDDVLALFHEMGHALHHLLTEIEEFGVSGITGVEWDTVELPSQWMENFAWEKQVLSSLTRHVTTQAPLPDALFQKIRAAKHFQAGTAMVRQLYFALFDIELYRTTEKPALQTLARHIQTALDTTPPPDYNRFAHSFGHIFSGGYAAGYYSYKWAEVLSADAYSAFEEGNGPLDSALGQRFKQTILARGSTRSMMESFVAFRGRPPRIDALLRHSGLLYPINLKIPEK